MLALILGFFSGNNIGEIILSLFVLFFCIFVYAYIDAFNHTISEKNKNKIIGVDILISIIYFVSILIFYSMSYLVPAPNSWFKNIPVQEKNMMKTYYKNHPSKAMSIHRYKYIEKNYVYKYIQKEKEFNNTIRDSQLKELNN